MWADQILPELLKRELGVHNWVDDRGGRTAHGITQRVADRLGIDLDTVTPATAMDIYEQEYYVKPGFNTIPSLALSWRLTVDGLHSGHRTIVKRVQWLHNIGLQPGSPSQLKLDGLMGPRTQLAIAETLTRLSKVYQSRIPTLSQPMAEHKAVMDLASQWKSGQFSLYCNLCDNDPSQRKWFNGWKNRIRFEPLWYGQY